MRMLCVTIHPALDKVLDLERLVPDEPCRARVEKLYGGGKGNNVARALTRLGMDAVALSFQGGFTGAYLRTAFADEGIPSCFIDCASPTRTSLILHERSTGRTYAIYEPGQDVSDAEVRALTSAFRELAQTAGLILLCGSGQTRNTVGLYASFIEIASRGRIPTVLDSSGGALELGIRAGPTMLKVNASELGGCLGSQLSTKEAQRAALRELCKRGISIVALTLGQDGLLMHDGHQTVEARLRMDSVVNVVGCGDSLLAGLARAMAGNLPLSEMARWGVACGAANTQVRGAGFVSPELVAELLPRVTFGDALP